jgi:hypothetical protein
VTVASADEHLSRGRREGRTCQGVLTLSALGDIVCQVTPNVSPARRREDSLLGHCIARGIVEDLGGIDEAVESYGPKAERLSKWAAVKAAAKVTPKASRVAGFIVMWAAAMLDEGAEAYSITEYERYWQEGERQSYRLQTEFRELWPEYETPNELARQVIRQVDGKMTKRDIATFPARLMVTV